MPSGVHNSPRGLALVDPETRHRVSQAGGFATSIYYGDLLAQERGERGGDAVLKKYGQDFFRQLSRLAHQRRQK